MEVDPSFVYADLEQTFQVVDYCRTAEGHADTDFHRETNLNPSSSVKIRG